ncbi:hypothetical protein COU54_03020 [Candidatus Pacearchaeota archaeon CG10_big_fil_rev_8_21_14_0_10_31_24]|nr:MAG: hypothetical protein COU54_03020 [Candidatus Pacearchaeota archaeon CG10_big_fil_rev_8_21_14_0_10_31_24]
MSKIINVKTIPNSKKEMVEKISEDEYKIHLKEVPEKNKANNKLIELLSDEFGVSKSNIRIKNPKSRKKIVQIKL